MGATPVAASPRIAWSAVPVAVRDAVDGELGSPVVDARPQVGGFSPGAAVRVGCADGRRAFVKAVGARINPDTPDLYRAEVVALTLLPAQVPAARLLASYDDGDWVALVLEDVEGRQPTLPWAEADVAAMTRTLTVLAGIQAPDALPPSADRVPSVLTGWDEVAADPEGVASALLRRLPELRAAQEVAREVIAGDTLVHWDARADNVLLRDGSAVLLDWAWASRGAHWLDTLLHAFDFVVQGGPDPDRYLRTNPVTADVPVEHLRALVACLGGMFTARAGQPAPPGLPTIRTWQAHCRDRALRWFDESSLWR